MKTLHAGWALCVINPELWKKKMILAACQTDLTPWPQENWTPSKQEGHSESAQPIQMQLLLKFLVSFFVAKLKQSMLLDGFVNTYVFSTDEEKVSVRLYVVTLII